MIFKFRMLSDENDNFVRDFEVRYDMSMLDFHNFITRSLDYDECMASFFTADDRWERGREFTAMDMGAGDENGPLPMSEVLLGQVMRRIHDRLIWLFDMFGNRAYYIELLEAKEAEPGRSYPRVVFEHAPAPDQYDPEQSEDEGSIFDEMMGDFNEFDGDDSYDDEY